MGDLNWFVTRTFKTFYWLSWEVSTEAFVIPLYAALICFNHPSVESRNHSKQVGRGCCQGLRLQQPIPGQSSCLRRKPVDFGEVGLNLAQGTLWKITCGQEFGRILSCFLSGPFPEGCPGQVSPRALPRRKAPTPVGPGFSSVQLCWCGTAPFGWLTFLTRGTDSGVASMAHSVLSLLTPAA